MVAAVTVVVVLVWVVVTYNRLVRLRNRAEEAWSGVDVQLQRRADLVPNLVSVVEGYAGHERTVFEAVTRARSQLSAARDLAETERADGALTAGLRQLFAVAEAYPELRASTNFLQLQRDLATIEEELAFSRRYYNATAEDLNTGIQTLPSVLVARPCGFRERPYFEAGQDERSAPRVELER